MPIHRGTDIKGTYYKYGPTGTKYYYQTGSEVSRKRAYEKARLQGVAIKISQNRRNSRRRSKRNSRRGSKRDSKRGGKHNRSRRSRRSSRRK